MPNPYGITEVDVPGLLAAYEGQQDRRVQRLLQQKQMQAVDADLERQSKAAEVWQKFNQGGVQGAAESYGAPPASPSSPSAGAPPPQQAPQPAYDPWDDPVAQRELIAGLSGLIEPQEVLEIRAAFRDASKEQREQAAANWDMIGSAALELRQLPQEQRAAEYQRIIPMLRTMGIPDEMLSQVDLSDRGLETIVNQSRDIEKVIAGRTPDVQAVPGVGLYPVTPGSPFPDFSAGGARPQAQIGAPNVPRVATPQEAAQLPPGTRFIDPNGVERVVPGGPASAPGGFPGY